MQNPFLEMHAETTDEELVSSAQSGSGEALERLLLRHRPWIFNVALRMLWNPQDADDVTQDILLRVLKALPTFRGECKFRTWLYRIAVNHVLNFKRQRWTASESICSFATAAHDLRQVPDSDLPDPRTVPEPVEILVEETRISCMVGTLLCLDGRQRIAFILGEIFGASDEVGAEIVGVTPVNFRQILSRARRDLYEYLRDNCSLVNPDNSCKCVNKTRAFIQRGFVDPRHLRFTSEHRQKVWEVAGDRAGELMAAYMKVGASVYRNHPFYDSAEQAKLLGQVLKAIFLEAPYR